MNRTLLALALGAAVVGGVALIDTGKPLPLRKTVGGDAVLLVDPPADQCPALLAGGGDRFGEPDGLDERKEHTVARTLVELEDAGVILLAHCQSGAQAGDPAVPCRCSVFLASEQLQVAKEKSADGRGVRALLERIGAPAATAEVRVGLSGGPKPADYSVPDDAAGKP